MSQNTCIRELTKRHIVFLRVQNFIVIETRRVPYELSVYNFMSIKIESGQHTIIHSGWDKYERGVWIIFDEKAAKTDKL